MSPASACARRSCSRSPTRSTSARSCRPVRLWRGRRQRNPLFAAAARSGAPATGARPCAPRSRPAAAATSSSAGPAPGWPGGPARRPERVPPRASAGPGASVARNASTPPCANHCRHRRTESSPTPNASPIRTDVQPDSVSSTARARSASPRTADPASSRNAACCSALASNKDRPDITITLSQPMVPTLYHSWHNLVKPA